MNTVGSFKCECPEGLTLDSSGRTCVGKKKSRYNNMTMLQLIDLIIFLNIKLCSFIHIYRWVNCF